MNATDTPKALPIAPPGEGTIARRVAAAMRCPIDFIGLAILVVSGAAIGAARALQVKGGWLEKPGLYAVVVARPGTTKTPALRAVMEPIYEEQDRLYQDYKAARLKYEEDLAAYKEARRNHDDQYGKQDTSHGLHGRIPRKRRSCATTQSFTDGIGCVASG